MKKSKILCTVLVVLMMFSMLVGCSIAENKDIDTATEQLQENVDNSTAKVNNEKIINDDGEEFIVDTTKMGEIIDNYESISSSKITIENVEYNLPFAVSELINNGWSLPDSNYVSFDNAFDPETSTSLVSFSMYNKDNKSINLREVYNSSSEIKKIEECTLTSINLDEYYEIGFILPGGITNNSTAADVLSVFGNPNNTNDFEWGYNLDDQLSYMNHNNSNLTYHFTFNDDGTIYAVTVAYEGDI